MFQGHGSYISSEEKRKTAEIKESIITVAAKLAKAELRDFDKLS